MIRELMVNGAKNIPANYAAKVDMVTGMGVQLVKGEVVLPSAETSDDLYMVAHEFNPEGIYSSLTNFDDYDEMVTAIKANQFVKLVPLYVGEQYGTDQYASGIAIDGNKGKVLKVGTDGKWDVATDASRYELHDIMDDNGHKLIVIRVLDVVKTVA